MAAIRKYWQRVAFILAAMAVTAMGFYAFYPAYAQQATQPTPAQTQQQAIDKAVEYSQVRALRQELSLNNRDLAAMGCDQAKAEATLGSLLTWYRSSKAELGNADKVVAQATNDLREIMRQINIGPKNDEVLAKVPGLRAAVAKARQDRKAVLDKAVAAVTSTLTESQQAVWTAAKSNRGLPEEYRYVTGLTSAQQKSLLVAYRARSKSIGSADARASSSAEAAFSTSVSKSLTADQTTAAADAKTAISAHTEDAQKASDKLLPLPTLLQEQMMQPTSGPATK